MNDLLEILNHEGQAIPLILKPDVGQRGYGVRIQRSEADLADYLAQADFEILAQRLSLLPREAAIFYVRKPNEATGSIFSITDKYFPVAVGDGRTPLGDLILQDPRARVIAPVYFSRLRKNLDSVPALDESVPLTECGNHCQGAIFVNGNDLLTPALCAAIDSITKQIPDFYFGQIDVRYRDPEALRAGQHFEIVEINGAGSEATHIWDANTTLFEAYRTLMQQWNLLFAIGDQVRQRVGDSPKARAWPFLKEATRVIFRKRPLSVSS